MRKNTIYRLFNTAIKNILQLIWHHRKEICAFLNAPFIIFALSTIVVSMISHSYIETQNCMAEANKIIEKYDSISLEIENRLRDISESFISAKTVADLKSSDVIKNRFNRYTYIEFKGRTLDDLFDEFNKLGSRIKFKEIDEETGDFVFVKRNNRKIYNGDDNDDVIGQFLSQIRNGYKDLSDYEFKELKNSAPDLLELISTIHKKNSKMLKNINCTWNEITQ